MFLHLPVKVIKFHDNDSVVSMYKSAASPKADKTMLQNSLNDCLKCHFIRDISVVSEKQKP